MITLRRIRLLLTVDKAALALLPEALWRLFLVRIQLLFPFAKTASQLGIQSLETPVVSKESDIARIQHITKAIRIMSRYTPWKSTCMVRAVAGLQMLEKRGIESTLYMGVAKDKQGQMIAHAWLRSGSYYVSGDDVMKGFVVVKKFAKVLHAE
ncbi:stage V sporulation protein S [Paenibacillus helianthi]|uniref:Stage V sporulation protein S n=1 Tax=Paenibacillus helianthi TaxID=1349432 RepID=A0ABX3EUR0_9BACL|nr:MULTISPECIES: lasso peptide biosynthesis B2 protein [Paenibacillus]OKP74636.1 stage V sporulation protein S [Paenibacillus sp. P3E]OKP88138.1 stage V sporulation protein S [Paenibacillus helianthi]OKP92770.1 stage V sporulation protein S [Paenibacillus sp. P32E]